MITKPIDLIVANTVHASVASVSATEKLMQDLANVVRKAGGTTPPVPKLNTDSDAVARILLCNVSHEADIGKVYAALKAVGAPDTPEMIREGIQAVKDRQPA